MADKPASIHHAQPSITFDAQLGQQANSLTHSSQSQSNSKYQSQPLRQHQSTAFPAILPRISQSMAATSHHQDHYAATMASTASKETKKLDISSLMSPPDPVIDSFSSASKAFTMSNASAHTASAHGNGSGAGSGQPTSASKHPLPMSPPISPYSKPIAANEPPTTPPGQTIQDPVLYPADDSAASSPPQPPLFATAELEDHRHIVEDHLRAQSPGTFGNVTPPNREDYMLALSFRSQVMKHYTANRKGWLRKERALLVADRQAGAAGSSRYHAIMPAKPIAAKPARAPRADRVSKPQGQGAPRSIRTQPPGAPAPVSSHAPVRPSARISATPEPSRRVVAPNREDKDFASLPDFCPPINSLPSRPNSLKVDWKGQPIDLSNDPNAHLLHPDEVTLAGNLRLDCATYLTSKRRIFERRLQCLRTGKEFRKTDAQQACKIDVNKASKLWTAFEKVGWLDAEWVRHHAK